MRIAQRLYERHDIRAKTTASLPYMRTDGVQIDGSAISKARKGDRRRTMATPTWPEAPRQYQAKAKNAQEAHEANPAGPICRAVDRDAPPVDAEQAKLYELIWTRTIASQMESAEQSADVK